MLTIFCSFFAQLYTAKGNHVHPAKKGTTAAVTVHQDKGVAWHRIAFGSKSV